MISNQEDLSDYVQKTIYEKTTGAEPNAFSSQNFLEAFCGETTVPTQKDKNFLRLT